MKIVQGLFAELRPNATHRLSFPQLDSYFMLFPKARLPAPLLKRYRTGLEQCADVQESQHNTIDWD